MIPTLICCAADNRKYSAIAKECGMLLGARLPNTIYCDIYFADQDWKDPNRKQYMEMLKTHRPHMATVLDLEEEAQFSEVMSWAEEAASFVEIVIIIPKVSGVIDRIPDKVNKKKVRLGYSVPTRYGKTTIPTEEFRGREVHLLGGSPHAQFSICGIHFPKEQGAFFIQSPVLSVKSLDGNMFLSMASRNCQFWCPGDAYYAQNPYWPTVSEEAGGHTGLAGSNYIAFRKSCENIVRTWKEYDI
jgi:hypothetical protein